VPTVETRALADGTLRYVVRVRDHARGRYTSATFATKPEAVRFVHDCIDRGVQWALEEYRREQGEASEPTVDEWAARHFDSLTNVTDGTLTTYRRIYRKTWSPALGHMHLSRVDREAVAKAVKQVPGSDKTVRNAWGVLTHIFKTAVMDGLIPRSPCVGIKLAARTTHERAEHRYLTHAEFWQLLDQTPPYWQPLVLTLAGTGMRWGEAAALEVGDVDLDTWTVRITKAEKWDSSKAVRLIGPTKTGRSRRTVTLPVEVVDAVRPLIEGRKRTERLFVPPKSDTLRHKTFYTDIWIKRCTVGLEPRPRIHDLRHSHVAWLIAANKSLPVIQARLGHEKITTTIDTYGHLVPDVQRAAADAASLVLGTRPKAIEAKADDDPGLGD